MPKPETLSAFEFFRKFPDEEAARQLFEAHRRGDEPVCGDCGSVNVVECKDHRPMPYRCRDCRKHFSVRTGTVLAESRLALIKSAGDLQAHQRPQGHSQHPDGEGTRCHSENRMVSRPANPRNLTERP